MDKTIISSHRLHGLVIERDYKVNLLKGCSYFVRAEGSSNRVLEHLSSFPVFGRVYSS